MANYEIMLIVSGSLKENEANKVATEIASSIKECKPKVIEYGSKQLAYKIKKDTTGYYYQYNFECESPAMINEFRRLASINKYVLRSLIINLEKDYGYRASVNPKKIERNKKTFEVYQKIKQKIEEAKAAKNAEKLSGKVPHVIDETSGLDNEQKVVDKKTTKKVKAEKSEKPKKESQIPTDKKHEVVSLEEFSNYDYDKRRKEWHQKAGHNDKQLVCDFCKDDDNWETVLLDNGKHVCYYCWIKKPADAKTTSKKTTTKTTASKTTTKKSTTTKTKTKK